MLEFEMLNKMDEMCKKYDRKDYPGIAIGVVENGELIFSKGYGIANLDYDIPINENTVFHACSIAKQFTAACIALLIKEGKLSLDQDIRTILPQLKDWDDKVTIYNLIHMTNGIPDVYSTACCVCAIREDTYITRDQFWRYVTACDWKFFKPGERWSYSNTGYFLLGQIVEAVTKVSLSQYADENIFKPLGMNNTFIRDDRTKIIKNRAVGYSNYDYMHFSDSYKCYVSRNDTLSINEESVEVGGAGQIWTTIKDFYLWDKNFYNNILGNCSKDLIELLTTPGQLSNGENCKYGWGLFVDEFHGNKIVHHGGCAGGYNAYYAQFPEKKLSVIILGNHSDFVYDLDIGFKNGGLMESILELLVGYEGEKHNTENKEFDETNINEMKFDLDLSGKYMDPITSYIWDIRKESNIYYVKDHLGNKTKIFYTGDGVFKSINKDKTYKVIQNSNQIIEYIELQEGEVNRTFYPFYKDKLDVSELKLYEGSYCCEKLGVSYNVKIKNDKLFISNANLHDNTLDLYYTPAIKDTFICVPNTYVDYCCITFRRNSNNEINSFSYRDNRLTLRENFVFAKTC